jgi:hypothetical protein
VNLTVWPLSSQQMLDLNEIVNAKFASLRFAKAKHARVSVTSKKVL